jgi:hypothetical protein
VGATLAELANGESSTSLAAVALIEAGLAPTTRVAELTPGSVTRTLAEAFGRELAHLNQQLEQVYEGAFVETGTGASLERLVERLERRGRGGGGCCGERCDVSVAA